jgi:hypothetical protein
MRHGVWLGSQMARQNREKEGLEAMIKPYAAYGKIIKPG